MMKSNNNLTAIENDFLVCMSDYAHGNYYCKQLQKTTDKDSYDFRSNDIYSAVKLLLDIAELPLSSFNRDEIIYIITSEKCIEPVELEDGFSIKSFDINNNAIQFSICKHDVILIEFLIIKNYIYNSMFRNIGIILDKIEKDNKFTAALLRQFGASYSGEHFDSILDEFNHEVSVKISTKRNDDPSVFNCVLKISSVKQMAYYSQYIKNRNQVDVTLFKVI